VSLPLWGGTTGHGHGQHGEEQRIVSHPMPGINVALANAVRQVNAAYNRLPESRRPDVHWEGVDTEVDAAIASGDRGRALAAIRAWKQHHLAMFEEAGR
jgi:hypothetical protein